jgi:hypothetical protein
MRQSLRQTVAHHVQIPQLQLPSSLEVILVVVPKVERSLSIEVEQSSSWLWVSLLASVEVQYFVPLMLRSARTVALRPEEVHE